VVSRKVNSRKQTWPNSTQFFFFLCWCFGWRELSSIIIIIIKAKFAWKAH
jgi:hypothetical protein